MLSVDDYIVALVITTAQGHNNKGQRFGLAFEVVEPRRIELLTSSLRTRRSPS